MDEAKGMIIGSLLLGVKNIGKTPGVITEEMHQNVNNQIGLH